MAGSGDVFGETVKGADTPRQFPGFCFFRSIRHVPSVGFVRGGQTGGQAAAAAAWSQVSCVSGPSEWNRHPRASLLRSVPYVSLIALRLFDRNRGSHVVTPIVKMAEVVVTRK